MIRRGHDFEVRSPAFVILVPDDRWWVATWNPELPDSPFRHAVYVDICTPPTWEAEIVEAIDLDLDVAETHQGTVERLDQDEFDEHRVALGYPPEVVAAATAASVEVAAAMVERRPPFDGRGALWLEHLADLSSS